MPKIQVSPFYRFCRVKVMQQQVDTAQNEVHLIDPYRRVTRRLANSVLELCRYMSPMRYRFERDTAI